MKYRVYGEYGPIGTQCIEKIIEADNPSHAKLLFCLYVKQNYPIEWDRMGEHNVNVYEYVETQVSTEYNTNNLLSEYDAAVEEFNRVRESLALKMQSAMKDMFQKFFETCPEIKAITWTQYTPYFNDGDECVFGVHDKWFIPAYHFAEGGELEDEHIPRGWDAEEYSFGGYVYGRAINPTKEEISSLGEDRAMEVAKHVDAMNKTLNKIPNDVYRQMFNDHVSVVVTKDGIDTEEYEHD